MQDLDIPRFTDIEVRAGDNPFYMRFCACGCNRVIPAASTHAVSFIDEGHVGKFVRNKWEEYSP